MYDDKFRKSVISYYYKYINISTNIVNDIKGIFSTCSATLYNWINLNKLKGNQMHNHQVDH